MPIRYVVINEELEPLFIPSKDKGFFTNKRLGLEKNKIDVIRQRRSEAGKLGVIAKRQYRVKRTKANASSLVKHSISNIDIDKEKNSKVIDRFSTINNDTQHIKANDVLNKQG